MTRNALLGTLPPDVLDQMAPLLSAVPLRAGQVLADAGSTAEHVFFIESGVVSLTIGPALPGSEVALVGRTGLVGAPALLDAEGPSFTRAVVLLPGSALRMRAVALRALADRVPAVRAACLRANHRLMAELAEGAAHTVCHTLAARCARWLLAVHDHAGTNTLPLTHDTVAALLHVRRAGVTESLAAMQSAGLVQGRRGRITVLDTQGLARVAAGQDAAPPRTAMPMLPIVLPTGDGKLATFAARLRIMRREYGQQEGRPDLDMRGFAAVLDVPFATYARYEGGEARPTLAFLVRLRRRTGIGIDRTALVEGVIG